MEKSWQGYITALGGQKVPASSIDSGMAFTNTEGGPSTGFVQWKPNDTLKKYDAMNSAWLGVEASEAAAKKIFKPMNAPVPR
uniref:Uncharacterized protein n=1 Tax=viral metagenome TaxID=1070528 RepID=A0A6C0JHK3_9ZZZZ